MTSINQQLEKEVYELIGDGFAGNSVISINALEAACLILDNKFGKDFHKKNPKLAVRFAETLMKNIRVNDFKAAVQNGIGEYLEALRVEIGNKNFKVKETMFEDYADSFRF